MFFMVAASFFIVCGVSAAKHDIYAGFSVPSTYTFTDTVTYNVGNRSYGTAAYIDISWSWANYRNFYTNKGASISVAGVSVDGQLELMSVSASDPTIDCTLDGNRICIYFNSDYNGSLSITLTYACNYTWYGGSMTGSPAPADSLQDVTLRTNFTLTFGNMNFYDSASIGMGDLNNKLNQILESLGESSGAPDFLGDDAYLYFDNRYFSNAYVPYGSASPDSNGFFRWSSSGGNASIGFFNQVTGDGGRIVSLFLSPGQYFFISSITNNAFVSSIVFEGVDSSYYSITPYATFGSNGYNYTVTMVTVVHPFACNTIYFNYGNITISNAVFYGAVVPADDDFIAGEAVNPDQSGLVEDVDNAGQQQQQQEEELWTNINSYKGDLTFNLDDWSEAAGGLSYVSSIFMAIWNNSPTQVIVLSLMLGIAMLSIGRGAMAAVRVSRNRRDND